MELTNQQKEQLAHLVQSRCKAVVRQGEYFRAYRSGSVSRYETTTVYLRTLRAIENNPDIISLERYAFRVATWEAQRYYRVQLVKERIWNAKHSTLIEPILETNRVRSGPIPVDPAAIVEERELHNKVSSLIARQCGQQLSGL